MSVVALCSVRGAPGVTTLSMLLAGCMKQAVVVEADVAGGVLAVRYGLGSEPGLTTLAASVDRLPIDWRNHAQNAGGIPVFVGPDTPSIAEALWHRAGTRIAQLLTLANAAVIADVGRLSATPSPMIEAADQVLVVVRPVAEQLIGLSRWLPTLKSAAAGGQLGLVLAGSGPYRGADVAGDLGIEIVGSFPDDRDAAATLEKGGSAGALKRSRLARAAVGLAGNLHETLPSASGIWVVP